MINIGDYCILEIIKEVDFGMYIWTVALLAKFFCLQGIFLKDAKVGDEIEVFLYNDSEDRLIATTDKPKAKVGEFALFGG